MQRKVFISYTLRGNQLSKNKLNDFKNALKVLNFLTVYIDILDNNNTISPQNEVIDRLLNADIVWVIHSDNLLKSEWVLKEIQIAKEYNKIIHHISVEIMDSIIQAKDISVLLDLIRSYI